MLKRVVRWSAVVGIVLLGGVGVAWAMHDRNAGSGVAVVELFTSEGCSSCPPADALLGRLVKENRERVYLLAFHVDYWNTPQWKDAFSSAEFSRRQEAYAKATGSGQVYTPQMIVNGSKGFVGSDEEVARREIAAGLRQKPGVGVAVSAKVSEGKVAVECTTDEAGVEKVLNVALVQRGIVRKVGGGENAGRSLSHENVVREFQSVKVTGTRSSFKLKMPEGADAAQCAVIAYVQDEGMHVLGAGAAELGANPK